MTTIPGPVPVLSPPTWTLSSTITSLFAEDVLRASLKGPISLAQDPRVIDGCVCVPVVQRPHGVPSCFTPRSLTEHEHCVRIPPLSTQRDSVTMDARVFTLCPPLSIWSSSPQKLKPVPTLVRCSVSVKSGIRVQVQSQFQI